MNKEELKERTKKFAINNEKKYHKSLNILISEGDELLAIVVSSINTARRNQSKI